MILAFAGSNSSTSINYQLVKYTTELITERETQLLNMANFPFPMYSEDHEKEKGFSNSLMELRDDIKKSDGVIISVNEHNGNLSAYFKNLMDWLSRLEYKFLEGKKVFLMSCSPGARGATTSLEYTKKLLPRFNGEVVASFSLPTFGENFHETKGITNPELAASHKMALQEFLSKI